MNSIITWPMLLVLIGALMAAGGGFWANINANQEKINNLENQTKFEHKLNLKNEEIILLNKEVIQYTVGGNNYPIITESIDHANSICHFSIGNMVGEKPFPLYDVHALIIDIDKDEQIQRNPNLSLHEKMNLLAEQKVVLRIAVGYLSGVSGRQHLFSAKLPPQNEEKNFKVTMQARNTVVVQKLTIYYDSEYSRYHVKSKAEKNSEVLFDTY